tara:strand:- start:196 stop:453 length:258 start_codon:yes stop_codon:yes gene_type:complete
MRKMRRQGDSRTVMVREHIIIKNMWEYYVISIDEVDEEDQVQYCYVMGFECEFGDVYIPEIEPYIISRTKNLDEVMPPTDFEWVE